MSALLLAAAVLGGCFKGNSNPLPDAAQLCNTIPGSNAYVQPMDSGNPMEPAATGGALVDGSYHLTSSTYYPSASCVVDQVATILVISSSSATAGTMQTASVTNTNGFLSESASYLINDTSLQIRIDCIVPDAVGLLGSAAQVSYSATPTEIQLYATGDCGNHIEVYDQD